MRLKHVAGYLLILNASLILGMVAEDVLTSGEYLSFPELMKNYWADYAISSALIVLGITIGCEG